MQAASDLVALSLRIFVFCEVFENFIYSYRFRISCSVIMNDEIKESNLVAKLVGDTLSSNLS